MDAEHNNITNRGNNNAANLALELVPMKIICIVFFVNKSKK